jgi:hypothetical protein
MYFIFGLGGLAEILFKNSCVSATPFSMEGALYLFSIKLQNAV